MDQAAKFVAQANIGRFLGLLEREQDTVRCSLWTRLLIAEEDRFAQISERLEIAENCLATCSRHIVNQRGRLASMDGTDSRLVVAKLLLSNLLDVRAAVEAHITMLKKDLG
ncbi:MAG TPA: hypothetical protein VG798_02905 [Rhizomicrobium sp.]|nr:hypothetical protein [Rhizomicrobium sp.]